jgi:hypothetical protein
MDLKYVASRLNVVNKLLTFVIAPTSMKHHGTLLSSHIIFLKSSQIWSSFLWLG